MIGVFLNGKEIQFKLNGSLSELLSANGLADKKGIAVAVNNLVITRSQWTMTQINKGDKIIIIKATQGG